MIHAGGQIPGQILKTCAKVNSSMKEMLYEVHERFSLELLDQV